MASSDGSLTITQIVMVLVIVGILVTVALVGCGACSLGFSGGLSDQEQRELERQYGADGLKSKGAKVETRKHPPHRDSFSIDLSGVPITDDLFDQIAATAPVSELLLSGSGVTDAHAARINAPDIGGYLLKLDLSNSEFSDAGLAQLKNLNLLRELNLTKTKVTAAAIAEFQTARQNNNSIMPMFRRVTIKK